jgi:hypothetical protein
MRSFHAAVVHADRSVTYCGTVGTDHLRTVRTMAALPGQEREGAGAITDGVPLAARGQGTLWIEDAIRLGDGVIGGPMDTPRNPPLVVHHTTESPAGGQYLEAVASYLIEVAAEPHLRSPTASSVTE